MKKIISFSIAENLIQKGKEIAGERGLTFSAFLTTLLLDVIREDDQWKARFHSHREPGRPKDSPREKRLKEVGEELRVVMGNLREMYKNQFKDLDGSAFETDKGDINTHIESAISEGDLETLEKIREEQPWIKK